MSCKYVESRLSNEVAHLPSHSIAEDILALSEIDDYFLPGDRLSLDGFEDHILGIEVLPCPDLEIIQKHPDWEGYRNNYRNEYSKVKLTLNVEMDSTTDLEEFLTEGLSGGDLNMKYLNHELIGTSESYFKVDAIVLARTFSLYDNNVNSVISSRFDNMWNRYMNALVKEGVCYIHNKVDTTLYKSLRKDLTYISDNTYIDYHPNSNGIVRDLVHPALYSYIKGVSKLKNESSSSPTIDEPGSPPRTTDYWGRNYEDSRFQWLPTPFSISSEGKCSISEYINNLDQEKFAAVYRDMEKLFDIFLPYFEEVWSYIQTTVLFAGEGDDNFNEDSISEALQIKPNLPLRGRELQVIVKMVEYSLAPEQGYEGVWHAEGMSHENIVMSGIFFIDRDPDLVGGDLNFKRGITLAERNHILHNVGQCRPVVIDNFAEEGFVPLGYLPTEEGYLLVFPNSHIHKISKLLNTSNSKRAHRRIIVFFVVNPDVTITSTRDVLPQQNAIPREQAEAYRLELMTERKYSKDKLNVRNIELCEH